MVPDLLPPLRAHHSPPLQPLPLCGVRVPAGFPSPADDWVEDRLDLNERYVQHPEATFFMRVAGESMVAEDPAVSIPPGALLIVDRSIQAQHGQVVVAVIDGDFTVKRLHRRHGQLALVPNNPAFDAIEIGEGQELMIWGVVTGWVVTP